MYFMPMELCVTPLHLVCTKGICFFVVCSLSACTGYSPMFHQLPEMFKECVNYLSVISTKKGHGLLETTYFL